MYHIIFSLAYTGWFFYKKLKYVKPRLGVSKSSKYKKKPRLGVSKSSKYKKVNLS